MSNLQNSPLDFQVLFLDMNSFFASVEQQVQPTLRGQPVGVTPYTGASGCIIAASYEAKALGIGTGTRVGEARRIYPKVKIVEARPALYMIYHKELAKVIESFTPYFQALSIDEFALRLTPSEQNITKSRDLALQIKRAIKERVGDSLNCSIGIGPSVFLAKMAGERKKPDGLTVVTLDKLGQFYGGLELRDLTGINFGLEKRLKSFGLNSPLALYNSSLGDMIRILKHWGRLWYFRLRGHEVDTFLIKNKTIGHSHVLEPEFRSREGALAVLRRLVGKAGYRLRKEGYMAGGVNVSVGFVGRESFNQSRKTPLFVDDKSFVNYSMEILKNCQWYGRPMFVAVSAFNLMAKNSEQISIFKDVERSKAISKAMDEVNDQFGADTLFPASMFGVEKRAPDRIPFGRPRYEILR